MKNEKPILFSGPMVRAILEGRKTQTRRIVKPQHIPIVEECFRVNGKWCNYTFDYDLIELSPYGTPGERLWVKETFALNPYVSSDYIYRATEADPSRYITSQNKWKPSIFCTRKASRITLEITAVRVERLQDISETDAIAEGIQGFPLKESCGTRTLYGTSLHQTEHGSTAKIGYEILWESINGAGSWDANPWVWVIEFKRI